MTNKKKMETMTRYKKTMNNDLQLYLQGHNTFPMTKIKGDEIKLPLDQEKATKLFDKFFAELEEPCLRGDGGGDNYMYSTTHINRCKNALLRMGFKAPDYTGWKGGYR